MIFGRILVCACINQIVKLGQVFFSHKGVLCLYCVVLYFRMILRVTGDVKTLNTESRPNFPTADKSIFHFIHLFSITKIQEEMMLNFYKTLKKTQNTIQFVHTPAQFFKFF